MGLSTGSRVTINGVQGTAIVVDWQGNACMVKYDKNDKIFEVRDHEIQPIFVK